MSTSVDSYIDTDQQLMEHFFGRRAGSTRNHLFWLPTPKHASIHLLIQPLQNEHINYEL